MLFMTLFFESVCFPTIVALGIRGLGRHYKRGSGFIVGGVCGGAVVPPILGHVADMRNDTGFAMIVPTMVCYKCLGNFALWGCIANVCNAVYGCRLDLCCYCQLCSFLPGYG